MAEGLLLVRGRLSR